jgi:2'-5' RNA ligase
VNLKIGVAIAVPEPYGSQLQQARAGFGDPLADTVPSHVTLAPPLDVDDSALDDVRDRLHGAAVMVSPFRMELRGTGSFRPVSPVVFVAVSQGISETEILASHVRNTLDGPEPEFPFHPHVTVAHHLDDAALDQADDSLRDYACSFDVTEFALYLHDDAAGWVPQHRFALGGR